MWNYLVEVTTVICLPGNLKEFRAFAVQDKDITAKIKALRGHVEEFALKFPMPGFEDRWILIDMGTWMHEFQPQVFD